MLRKLVDDGAVPALVVAFQQRMEDFFKSEKEKGHTPLVVVAGDTANAAFDQFKLPAAVSIDYVGGFRVARYPDFTALLGAPHPSAHLKALTPTRLSGARALFRETFTVAARLLEHPGSTAEELEGHLSLTERQRHESNAQAIDELKLPGCEGSWFSPEFRHLRYINWTVVLPVVRDMLRRMTMESIWQLLQIKGLCKVAGAQGGDAAKMKWIDKLKGENAKILNGDSFWAFVAKDGGDAAADKWIAKLKGENASIVHTNSFWAFVGKDGGDAAADKWIDKLKGKNAKFMKTDSFWSLVGTTDGSVKVNKWMGILTGDNAKILNLGSFWLYWLLILICFAG
jgi:hypothetical protein